MITIMLSRKLGELRVTQAELAEKTGIRPNTINDLFHNVAERVSLEHLDKICEALDICLFAEDFEQLCNRNNEPVLLSMLLYNKLLSQKKNVFLYSTYDVPNEIADAWTEMYTTAFDQKNIPIIFNRKGAAIHTKQSLLNLISNNGGLA